jgi:glutamate carboxypeptidase
MRLATQGRATYAELGLPMTGVASGGGTDAAFAALQTRAAVIEGLGLSGFGAHSTTPSSSRSAPSCRVVS